MSMQVDPQLGQEPADPLALAPPTANTAVAPQPTPAAAAGVQQNATGIPQALNVCCNGNYGVYLLARRGVQCMCGPCQAERTSQPSAAWIMSPTEFERHSGMPTAKKWRMSIKVSHVGEPDLPLGRWLELKGISQQRGQQQQQPCVSASPESSHEQQTPQQQKAKAQSGSQGDAREAPDTLRPCASSLARVLLQGLGRDQTGQMQGQSRLGALQRSSSGTSLHAQHPLSEEPPHCNTGGSGSRHALSIDVAAQLRSCFPSQHAGAGVFAAVKLEAARVAAYAAAAAEAEAAAAQAEQQVCTQQRQQPQYEQGSNEDSPNGGRSSSSSQGGQLRPSPPTLLEIPCPADEPPRHNEPSAAAMYNSVDPVPLEEAAAAAARGDDSLWLRSPMRRTPCSARQGSGGASRICKQEAVAAEAFRRLITAHLHPKAAAVAAAAAAAAAAGRSGQQQQPGSACGLGSAATAAAALLASSLPATAGSGPSDGSSSDAVAPAGTAAAGSMDSLLAAAAAAAAADAAEQAGADGDDEEEGEKEEAEGGICVGPEHQADLPRMRPVPAFAAAVALMELKKSGYRAPAPEEALRLALEEKARSDLLPRDAVEDVWERANSGLALERAQRQRKPPGWQAGYIDPLKPLTAQHNQADSGQQGAANGQEGMGLETDSGRNRKRSNQGGLTAEEAQLHHSSKKMRCGSMGPGMGTSGPPGIMQASRLGPGSLKGRRVSLDGTPLAGCCSEPACPGSILPRVPPNGFWVPNQPMYSAPVGPELLSWVLLVPPLAAAAAAAATTGRAMPGVAAGPDHAAAGMAAGPAAGPGSLQKMVPAVEQTGKGGAEGPDGKGSSQQQQQQQPVAGDGGMQLKAAQEPPAAPPADAAQANATATAAADADATATVTVATDAAKCDGGSSMDVDTPPQQQQLGSRVDSEMPDVVQDVPAAAVLESTVQPMQAPAAAPLVPAAAAAPSAPTFTSGAPHAPDSATVCGAAAADVPAGAPPAPAVAVRRCAAGPCVECCGSYGSLVEVRIVLDGCVFVGQLSEVSRLEMGRSRIGAAVQPLKQAEVHALPPPGTTCVLCHAPEAPGAHMDQAKALRSSGLSNRGLGPLMPVCMPPAKQAAVPGNRGDQPAGSGKQAEPAAAGDAAAGNTAAANVQRVAGSKCGPETPVAAAAAADRPASLQGAAGAPAADGCEVVWVHRQCALWSPEVYPDKAGALMHLPGAIRRGRATRCSHCGQKGATLKCVERSCAQHFHLACARVAGCTLMPEPYAVGCTAHAPKLPDAPVAAVLTAFPSSRPAQPDQQPQPAVIPEHPQLPVLRCRTTRHRALGEVTCSGTPLAGSRDGTFTPLYPGGGSPMHMDSCGLGGPDSDFLTPRAGSEDRGDLDMPAAAGTLAGLKRSRGGQSRLRRQTNTDWADDRFGPRPNSPAGHLDDATPTAAAAAAVGRQNSAAKPCNSRGSRGAAGGNSARGSFGSTQLHDSRGRFMSHAAAQLLASGFTSTPTATARQRSAGRELLGDGMDSRGGTPAVSDGPGYSTPRGAAADADGAMSDVSSGAPSGLTEASLGGTTGQPGRAGRCAVCVVQRKGKCGTESAPKKCLRRQLQEQQQAERAKKAAPILSVAAAASAVAIAAAEAEALAAARNSPAPRVEPTAATAAMARVAAEAEALAAARNSPALKIQPEPGTAAPTLRDATARAAAAEVAASSAAPAAAAAADDGSGSFKEAVEHAASVVANQQPAAAAAEQRPDSLPIDSAAAADVQAPQQGAAAGALQEQPSRVEHAQQQYMHTQPQQPEAHVQQQQQHPMQQAVQHLQQLQQVPLGGFQALLMSDTMPGLQSTPVVSGDMAPATAAMVPQPVPLAAQQPPAMLVVQQPGAAYAVLQQQLSAAHQLPIAMAVQQQQHFLAAAASKQWCGFQAEPGQVLQLLPQPAATMQAPQDVFGGVAAAGDSVAAAAPEVPAASSAAVPTAPLSAAKQELAQHC